MWAILYVIIPLYILTALGEGVGWLIERYKYKHPRLNYRRNM